MRSLELNWINDSVVVLGRYVRREVCLSLWHFVHTSVMVQAPGVMVHRAGPRRDCAGPRRDCAGPRRDGAVFVQAHGVMGLCLCKLLV